jgi:hypothetical protein
VKTPFLPLNMPAKAGWLTPERQIKIIKITAMGRILPHPDII